MTGLTGYYNFQLTCVASESSPQVADMRAVAASAGVADSSEARLPEAAAPIATIFQALQSSGLKMDAKKSPTEVLIIDSADRAPRPPAD